MDRGITLEIVWADDDLIELRIEASNGSFAGAVGCYAGHDSIAELAAALRGFPASSTDRREWQVGTFDPGYAGGGARFVLRCVDAVGHAVAEISLRADPASQLGTDTASFSVPVEPSAIDEFVLDLLHMQAVGSTARLRRAT